MTKYLTDEEVREALPEEKDINSDSGAYGWNACREEILKNLVALKEGIV